MKLSLIVAVADNGVIGKDNAMPWHIPGDLKYFKATTMGKPIIMGRKTFDSLGRPLPGRPNLVITRNLAFHADGATCVSSIEEALQVGDTLAAELGVDEVMVIGGAAIFAYTLPLAHRLYFTEVHAAPTGDVFFPAFERATWHELSRTPVPATEAAPAHDFVVLERNPPTENI